MQTNISEQFKNTSLGQEADSILRNCVHCGFCTATCPTYQLLGDELDGPRGRIYLIKQMLEGNEVSQKTQIHLDRCLNCRSCETTCPSGVQYGRLIDIGRELVEENVVRDSLSRLTRYALRKIIPYPQRFSALLAVARLASPVLPEDLRAHLPKKQFAAKVKTSDTVSEEPVRHMLLLEGCVQSVATPDTNLATKSVLQKLGVQLHSAPDAGCCGALSHHLSAEEESLNFIRRNIDAWWPFIETHDAKIHAEALVITASGCGTMIKDYGYLLKDDSLYAAKAQRVSELAKDISEILRDEEIADHQLKTREQKIVFHSPCTLQHGQKLDGVVENILQKAGYELSKVKDSHLCCGSAGTYSIMQPELSQKLLHNKLKNLTINTPEVIATANIGCQMHIQSKTDIPVRHWIQLLDDVIV